MVWANARPRQVAGAGRPPARDSPCGIQRKNAPDKRRLIEEVIEPMSLDISTCSPVSPRVVAKAKVYPHLRGSIMRSSTGPGLEDTPHLTPEDRERVEVAIAGEDFERAVDDARLSRASITLTKAANLHKPVRARTGSKGISARGRHSLQAAAATLERKCPVKTLGFFTGTVPATNYQDLDRVMRDWPRVVKNFLEGVRYALSREGHRFSQVHCTEIQESRFRKTGLPVLHLHMVFRARKNAKSRFYLAHDELRRLWIKALNSLRDEDDFYLAITDCQVVEKSVVSYLGKYMSKGVSGVGDAVAQGCTEWFPKQWWGCSRHVARASRRLTVQGQDDLVAAIKSALFTRFEECFRWAAPIELDTGEGGKVQLGWAFEVQPAFYEELLRRFGVRQ